MTLSWDHVTGGQQGQKERTESLSLDPMLQTKSLKVGYPRSRVIPPPDLQLGVVWVWADPFHPEDPRPEVFQTCATGVRAVAQHKGI